MKDGGIFLLNTIWDEEKTKRLLPAKLKKYIAEHNIQFYIINAVELAREVGLGRRINTVMSTAFFEVTDIMTRDEYMPLLKGESKIRMVKSQKKL
ncbi:2-oxoacid:acceptor oxidoreductase family protein [Flavobacterium paronense]|nr:2-oxoacid:acceptor oxidoreductase family protein [Flavobacterium paronense]MDN3675983.1 2-oxoacid:acceptor oxidoreductase family protein [Flavobacterium paronense]